MDKFQLAMLIYWRMVFSCQGLGMVSGIGLFSQDSGFGRFAGPEGLRGLCNLELLQKKGGYLPSRGTSICHLGKRTIIFKFVPLVGDLLAFQKGSWLVVWSDCLGVRTSTCGCRDFWTQVTHDMGMQWVTNQHFTELTNHEGCEESHKKKQGDRWWWRIPGGKAFFYATGSWYPGTYGGFTSQVVSLDFWAMNRRMDGSGAEWRIAGGWRLTFSILKWDSYKLDSNSTLVISCHRW